MGDNFKSKLKQIKVKEIKVGKRTRKKFGEDAEWEDFKKSISEIQLTPITVKPIEDDNFTYELIAGERRLRAFKELERSTIAALIIINLDDIEEFEFAENFFRKNFELDELSDIITRIHERKVSIYGTKTRGPSNSDDDITGWGVSDTAKLINVSPRTVSRYLKANLVFSDMKDGEKKKITNISEVDRVIKKQMRQYDVAINAKKVEEKIKNTPTDIRLKNLIEQFIILDSDKDIMKSGITKEILKMPDKSFDGCEFDPPYAINLSTEKHSKDNIMQHDENYTEITKKDFLKWLPFMLKEIYRVMKDDTWLILWFGPHPWTNYPIEKGKDDLVYVNLIYQWIADAGFNMKRTRSLPGQWYKFQGQTQQPDIYLGNDHEMYYYAAKGYPKLNWSSNATYAGKGIASQRKWHATQKPIGLYYKLFTTFFSPGSNILCPCVGSGIPILGADDAKCRLTGYDIKGNNRLNFIDFVNTHFNNAVTKEKKWCNIDWKENQND